MKISMGTEVKKAPKASNEIPPKVNIIPPGNYRDSDRSFNLFCQIV